MTEDECHFNESQQQSLISELQIAAGKQSFRLHFVATEPTHVHGLLSWKDERPWMRLRVAIKWSLTGRLKREYFERKWLSEGASRKRISEQEHFDYLVGTYLAEHSGWKWSVGSIADLDAEGALPSGYWATSKYSSAHSCM